MNHTHFLPLTVVLHSSQEIFLFCKVKFLPKPSKSGQLVVTVDRIVWLQ